MKRHYFIIALGFTIVVLSFALAACVQQPGNTQPPVTVMPTQPPVTFIPTQPPVTVMPTKQPGTDMPIEQLIPVTRLLLDDFWSRTFAADGLPYKAVTGVHSYNTPTQSACGPMEMNNAFYCTCSHSIYYDEAFLRSLYKEGDFAVVTLLAHEWGHLVQANLGIFKCSNQQSVLSIQLELQADCLAGVFAKHIYVSGFLEEGDLDEGGENLFKIGDPKGTPWFHPAAHGKPIERVYQYMNGWNNGHQACKIPELPNLNK